MQWGEKANLILDCISRNVVSKSDELLVHRG